MTTPKDLFLADFDREVARTLRVLKAYPPDQAELRPTPRCRAAREIAWTLVLERGLGTNVIAKNAFTQGVPAGRTPPPPPDRWNDIVSAYEQASGDYAAMIRGYSDAELQASVKFFVGPKTLGDWTRLDFARFLLHDEIHHRGQLSVYLRAAGGKVPAIYGPSEDEPWR